MTKILKLHIFGTTTLLEQEGVNSNISRQGVLYEAMHHQITIPRDTTTRFIAE